MTWSKDPSRASVLLVDDNAINRLALSRWLEKQGGYQVVTAADGEEALRRVRGEPFDLVLLDVMMPVMGGLEVLQRLRERYSSEELPIIMATARDQSEDVVQAFNLGANDYITKPIDFPVALARIQAHLRTTQRTRQSSSPYPAVTSLAEIKPGVVLEGKYRLDEMIGSGAHGVVFRATHLNLDRQVAIKILTTSLGNDPQALEHFQHEGISACRVDHPNAVAVLDFTASRHGVAFLVMELLNGHSLQEEIQRHGRLSPERAAEILFPVCDVLADAQALGVVHRDVKPQNTFLHQSRRGEVVKVLDFGLARLLEETAEDDPTAEIAGTLAYISPERILGMPYDGRSDVYSLGVVLYEMLTGELPFVEHSNNPVRMMMLHVQQPPPPLRDKVPELDPAIEEVVLAALEKEPSKRPTAVELKERFARAVGVAPGPRLQDEGDDTGVKLRFVLEKELARELAQRRNRAPWDEAEN